MVTDASTDVNVAWQYGYMGTATLPIVSESGYCCAPVTGAVIDAEHAERLALGFKALSDPTRLRLLSLISATEGGEACICDLTDPVDLSQPTVSHHMKVLAQAGLVTREQRGKWAYYRVVDEAMTALADALHPSA